MQTTLPTSAVRAAGTLTRLAPAEVEAKHRAGEPIALVDVRTPIEFAAVHAANAIHVPLDSFDPAKLPCSAGSTPVLLCKSGGRATKAANRLVEAGIDCIVVEGGTDAWVAAGLPVVRERSVISLERQVRIAAGSLVLIGAVLALLVHPYFIGLSAFVGAGLVFAGVTNTCGMGLLLARMPWNRVASTK
jgi:rhodanese-related sulfurtransferase